MGGRVTIGTGGAVGAVDSGHAALMFRVIETYTLDGDVHTRARVPVPLSDRFHAYIPPHVIHCRRRRQLQEVL